jgi:Carboxypeptidase regulatory-like domain
MRRAWLYLSAVLAVVCVATMASAQTVTSTTGAINGKVLDTTKGTLPGVTVTITGTTLMGTRNTTTMEDGVYRFGGLPPGDYSITYELAGFRTLKREDIRVGAGFTATVDVEMVVGSLQESVQVTGVAPLIDRAATSITTTYDKALLSGTPVGSRDYWGLLATTPSVQVSKFDVGGSAAMTVLPVNVYGITGQEHPLVEGMIASSSTGGVGFSFYGDYGSFEEVAVSTAGHTAETGQPGLFSTIISKSGGNTYHGSFYGDYQSDKMQAHNIDAAQLALGVTGGGTLAAVDVNRTAGWRELNVGLGGYIVKDKLWWYGSYSNLDFKQWYVNYPPEPQHSVGKDYTFKGTYQLSPNNKFIGYMQRTGKLQDNRFDGYRLSATAAINTTTSVVKQDYNSGVWKGEYNRVMSNKAFFEIRTGSYWFHFPFERLTEDPRIEDISNNLVTGGNENRIQDRKRNQLIGSISYFKDRWYGTHNFKVGGNVLQEYQDYSSQGFPNEILMVKRNGAAAEVYQFQPGDAVDSLMTDSLYVTDAWQLPKRVNLNLGVRFDRFRAYTPAATHMASLYNPAAISFPAQNALQVWNLFAPRLGGTWSLTEDGKSLLKMNYARYWYDPGYSLAVSLDPNQTLWFNRYAWTDKNGNGVWDPGEQGNLLQTSGGTASTKLDPNLQDTYVNEVAGWFERQLSGTLGLRAGVVWRGLRQQYTKTDANRPFSAYTVPITIPDPGPDGKVGTADDGPGIPGLNIAPQYIGIPSIALTTNVPNSDANFITYEFSASKNMSHHWSLNGSFAYTQNWFNNSQFPEAQSPNTIRTNTLPLTPQDLINAPNGQYRFTNWSGKLISNFQLPKDFKASFVMREQAGISYGRTFDAALNYSSSVRILAEPMTTQRQRNVAIADARVEKAFKLTGSWKVSAMLDCFNLFNSNPEERISWNSGTSYLRPLQIIPPRVFRVAAKMEW